MRYAIPAAVLALGLGLSACNQSASTEPTASSEPPAVVVAPGAPGPAGPPGPPGEPGATVVAPVPAPPGDTKVTIENK